MQYKTLGGNFMKQYFRLLALVLIFCTGCGAQQASTTNLTDTASPSAIVSGAAVTPEAVTATGPAALPQNTVNPTVSTCKTHTKNGYENTIFTTKNYVYSTDGEGILQAPIAKSKTGAFSYPKKGTHYVIKPDTDNDFTVSDMYVTDSYLYLVEYDTDYTNLWRIPFRRSGTKEILRWEDREKVCKLEDIIKKDSPGIDWEDFLYAEDNKVIFSSKNDGIFAINLDSGKISKLFKDISYNIVVDEYGVPRKYDDTIFMLCKKDLYRVSVNDFSVKKICQKVTRLFYYAPEEDVSVSLFPTTVHKNRLYFLKKDGIYGYDMKSEKTEQIVSLTDIESLLSGKRNGFRKDIIETWNVYQFFALKGRIYAILNANQLTYSSRDDENYVYDEDFEDDYKTYDYKLSVVSFRASDGKDLRYETQMNTFLQEKLAKTYECCDYDGLNYWTIDTGTPLCPVGKGQWIIEFPTQLQKDGKRYKSDYYLYDVLTGNSTKIESREGQQMKEYKVRFKSYNGFC